MGVHDVDLGYRDASGHAIIHADGPGEGLNDLDDLWQKRRRKGDVEPAGKVERRMRSGGFMGVQICSTACGMGRSKQKWGSTCSSESYQHLVARMTAGVIDVADILSQDDVKKSTRSIL